MVKTRSLTEGLRGSDVSALYAILLGRLPEFDISPFDSSDQTIREFAKFMISSGEYQGVLDRIANSHTLPHSSTTDVLDFDGAVGWIAAFTGTHRDRNWSSWWQVLQEFFRAFGEDEISSGNSHQLLLAVEIVRQKSLDESLTSGFKSLISSRVRSCPLFDPHEYLSAHPDVKSFGMDAYEHYLQFGRSEGRTLYNEAFGAMLLGEVDQTFAERSRSFIKAYLDPEENNKNVGLLSRPVHVYTHTRGNYYMRPIAEATARALKSIGVAVQCLDEKSGPPSPRALNIVVAPHEFFELPLPDSFRSEQFHQSAVIFNTEQLPSRYFSLAMRDIFGAKGVIDISFQTAELLNETIPSCYFLPPVDLNAIRRMTEKAQLSHPLFRSLDEKRLRSCGPETAIRDRPIDVFFAGFASNYRDSFFLREASYLASKECFFPYTRLADKPAEGGIWGQEIFDTNALVTCGSKIVLAIHRYPTGYIEWERMIVQGFASGSCVLATPGIESPFFQAGEHYLELPLRHFGLKLRELLDTDAGRLEAERVARAGQARLVEMMSDTRSGFYLLAFLRKLESRH